MTTALSRLAEPAADAAIAAEAKTLQGTSQFGVVSR
jgi:hypothetical protein